MLAAALNDLGWRPGLAATRLANLNALSIKVGDDGSGKKSVCAIQRSKVYDREQSTLGMFPSGGDQNTALMANMEVRDTEPHPIGVDDKTARSQLDLPLRVGKIGRAMLAAKTALASARNTIIGRHRRGKFDCQSSAVAASSVNMTHADKLAHLPG